MQVEDWPLDRIKRYERNPRKISKEQAARLLKSYENLGRRGRGIEISEKYCAVILERMSVAFPGIKIQRVK